MNVIAHCRQSFHEPPNRSDFISIQAAAKTKINISHDSNDGYSDVTRIYIIYIYIYLNSYAVEIHWNGFIKFSVNQKIENLKMRWLENHLVEDSMTARSYIISFSFALFCIMHTECDIVCYHLPQTCIYSRRNSMKSGVVAITNTHFLVAEKCRSV